MLGCRYGAGQPRLESFGLLIWACWGEYSTPPRSLTKTKKIVRLAPRRSCAIFEDGLNDEATLICLVKRKRDSDR